MILAEGMGIEARSKPPIAEKRVFRGAGTVRGRRWRSHTKQSTSDRSLRAVKVFDRLTFLPELIRR